MHDDDGDIWKEQGEVVTWDGPEATTALLAFPPQSCRTTSYIGQHDVRNVWI